MIPTHPSALPAVRRGRARSTRGLPGLAWRLLHWLKTVLLNRDGAIGSGVAVALGAALLTVVHLRADDVAAAEQDRLRLAVSLAASVIEADVARSLAAADTVDAMLRSNGRLDALDAVAIDLRERFPLLGTVALAPGGVVRQVSPTAMAPSLTGVRLQDDPALRPAVTRALRTRQMAASPAPAGAQGAVVNGFQPVLRRGPDGTQQLWGLVWVSVRVPDLASYLSAAQLSPVSVRAELDHVDPRNGERVLLSPPALGDQVPQATTATVRLPGATMQLRVSARHPWLGSLWPQVQAVAAALAAGSLCIAWRRRQRRLATRRLYFATSQILNGWSSEFDAAHARLDALRNSVGQAVLVAVRLPLSGTFQRLGAPVARGEQRDWSGLLHATKREGDLLLHLHANDYLLVAHGLPSRAVAARVRHRLHSQLHDLTAQACGPNAVPLFLESVLFEPAVREPGEVLAKLLVALHATDAAPARPLGPATQVQG